MKSLELSNACETIHTVVDRIVPSYADSPVEHLIRLALEGCFITENTIEAINLTKDIAALRELADKLDGIKEKLLVNEKQHRIAS